jgi:Histone acetyltransferase subunit NuA4
MSAEEAGQSSAILPQNLYSLEDLAKVEEELQQLLQQKQALNKNLQNIENSLYNLETSYIEDSTYGNIIKGYDAFLNARTLQNRRQRPTEQERIFSRSSVNYTRNHHDDSPPPPAYAEDPSGDGDFVLEKSFTQGSSSRRKKRNSEIGSRLKKRVVYSDEEE